MTIKRRSTFIWMEEVVLMGLGTYLFVSPMVGSGETAFLVFISMVVCLLTSEFKSQGWFVKYANQTDTKQNGKDRLLKQTWNSQAVRGAYALAGFHWYMAYGELPLAQTVFWSAFYGILPMLIVVAILKRRQKQE